MAFLSLLLILVLSTSAAAATRLGLHVTQEEVVVWQARRTDNVNGIGGHTYQTIYNNQILNRANAFKGQAHPGGDGRWLGYTGAGCVNTSTMTPMDQLGKQTATSLQASAFHFLLTGDTTYAAPVRTELLNQITQAGTNWANSSKWCPNNLNGSNVLNTLPWLIRLIYAYDYLKAGNYTALTSTERTNIENWFRDAAVMWNQREFLWFGGGDDNYNGIFAEPPNFICTNCDGAPGTPLYLGGPPTSNPPYYNFFNQNADIPAFSMLVGVLRNDASLISVGRKFFNAFITLGVYDEGGMSDDGRWTDCNPECPRSAWGHAGGAIDFLTLTADTLARTGDTSLYDLQVATQVRYGSGGQVSLKKVLQFKAQLANGTLIRYGTTSAAEQDLCHRITWNLPGCPVGGDSYWDFTAMMANLYYQDPAIHTAMTRNWLSGSVHNNCADSQLGCFGGANGMWPSLPFMFGNMEGVVDPYGVGTTSPPTCVVTAPTAFPIYDTATTPFTTLQGTATAPGGFDTIGWVNDRGGSGAASGTTNWTVSSIPLQTGTNVITVTVTDDGALTGTCQLRVRYQTTADATSNLVLHLPLDEGTLTFANNTVVGQNDGTLSGATSWVAGHVGTGAVQINDNTGKITVTGLLTSPAAITLEARFRFSSLPAGLGDLFSMGDAVAIRISSGVITGFYYNGTTWHNVSSTWTGDSAWHSAAFMVKAGEQTLYLDGTLVQYATNASAPAYTGSVGTNTIIGGHGNGNAAFWFSGTVDNPRVWARYLSRVDLQAALAATPQAPLIAITAPTTDTSYTTTVSPLTTLEGTASDPDGTITGVAWVCTPGCGSGAATLALPNWSIPSVTLLPGTNNVTVTATDNAGQSSQDSVGILFPTSTPTVFRLIQ